MAQSVQFHYDESVRRWQVFVTGAQSATEAKQAFHAVCMTVQLIPEENLTLDKTIVRDLPPGGMVKEIIPYGVEVLNLFKKEV